MVSRGLCWSHTHAHRGITELYDFLGSGLTLVSGQQHRMHRIALDGGGGDGGKRLRDFFLSAHVFLELKLEIPPGAKLALFM